MIRSTRDTAARTVTLEENEAERAGTGPRITWVQLRGPGKATFDPAIIFTAAGKEAVTKVSFSEPGTFVLRAFARDAQFRSRMPADVTVTVTPGSSASVKP